MFKNIFPQRNRPQDPHAGRRVDLVMRGRQSPLDAVKNAVWALIMNNCDPPQPFSSSNILSGQQNLSPIRDITVQTFYVVYEPNRNSQLNALDAEQLAEEIMREMVSTHHAVFESYLRNKVGASVWDQAAADDAAAGTGDHTNRLNVAKNIRLVELLRCPVDEIADPCVVGRESLAVEVARLRDQGKDPRVIAQIYVSGSANVNPHTREAQRSKNSGRGETLCVLEGRAASIFFIGPNSFDDIQVEEMPPGEWYQMLVLAPDQMPVSFKLSDSSGKQIEPTQSKFPLTWELKGPGELGEWTCKLEATTYPNLTISQVAGLPEIPPSIRIVGRVLPKGFPIPDELAAHLRSNGDSCETAVKLEDGLYLYVSSSDQKVYVTDLDGSKSLTVDPPSPARGNAHALDELSTVTVGRVRYSWRTDGLPPEIVGRLEFVSQTDCPSEEMPVIEGSPNSWVIGRRHRGAAQIHGSPIFIQNSDQYLSRNGNLLISCSGRSQDGRPTFMLTLLSERELPLFVWPYHDSQWSKVAWPNTSSGGRRFEVPGLELIGVSNKMIFGTSYYNIATSHTLTSRQ